MQKYKITKAGSKLLRLPMSTMIIARVGNKPASGLWKPYGKPF